MSFMKVTLYLIFICTLSWQMFIFIPSFHAACLLGDYSKRKTLQTKSKSFLNQLRLRKYLTLFHVKYVCIPLLLDTFIYGYTEGQREIIKGETGNSMQCTGLLFSFYEKVIYISKQKEDTKL